MLEYAGKGPAGDSMQQGDIEARMVELAQEGKIGRAPEGRRSDSSSVAAAKRPLRCAAAGIAFRGRPGSDRRRGRRRIRGHPRDPSRPRRGGGLRDRPRGSREAGVGDRLGRRSRRSPARSSSTWASKNLPRIAEQLIEAGRRADEPAAVIQQGTTPTQRTVIGAALDDLPRASPRPAIKPPALTVIGDVVAERERIEWFEQRPLLGRQIVVTRARAQASTFAAQLARAGREVVRGAVDPHRARDDDAVRNVASRVEVDDAYEHDRLHERKRRRIVLRRARARRRSTRARCRRALAVVGGATGTRWLRSRNRSPTTCPSAQTAEGLLELRRPPWTLQVDGCSLPLASDAATGARPTACASVGADVQQVAIYDTVAEALPESRSRRSPAPTSSPSPAARRFTRCWRRSAVPSHCRPHAGLDRTADL